MKKMESIKKIMFVFFIMIFLVNCTVSLAIGANEIEDQYEADESVIDTLTLAEANEWLNVMENHHEVFTSPSGYTETGPIYPLYPDKELVLEIIDKLEARIQVLQSEAGSEEPEETPAFSHGSWISPDDYNPGDLTEAGEVISMGNRIIGIFQFIGSFASVLVLIVLGIKYMAGSVEERAEYKQTMWPYVVGAALVFATTTILSIIEAIAGEI